MLEKELGRNVDELFERFDADPIGSASIAQVTYVPDLFIELMTISLVVTVCSLKQFLKFCFWRTIKALPRNLFGLPSSNLIF